MWLVAERCDAEVYSGWHIYLREVSDQRNAGGSWGWIRRGNWMLPSIREVLALLGIAMRPGGDGSCDDDGYAELARKHPLGDGRGGVIVDVTAAGVTLSSVQP